MDANNNRFNRILIAILAALYLVSLFSFIYIEWSAGGRETPWMMALNALILSLPLVMFYGSIYVLISAWREFRRSGQVGPRMEKVIHWAPRIAAIVIIFFVGLFSLDVFEMEGTPLQLLGAFIMHSLPSIFMAVVLVFAWRWPLVGFIAFLIAGLLFMFIILRGGGFGTFLIFSGPLLLIAAMFYVDWRLHKAGPPAPHAAAV